MPDFTNLVTNASLNAKPNEVKDEIPSILTCLQPLPLLPLKMKYLILLILLEKQIMMRKY